MNSDASGGARERSRGEPRRAGAKAREAQRAQRQQRHPDPHEQLRLRAGRSPQQRRRGERRPGGQAPAQRGAESSGMPRASAASNSDGASAQAISGSGKAWYFACARNANDSSNHDSRTW